MTTQTQHPVYTLTNECKDCYKCVRHCPVKAIKIENDHASVIPEKCISCGHCVQVCPTNAKCVRTDIEKVKNLFIAKKDVYVSLAPSWRSVFENSAKKMIAVLKKLGFKEVSETALGAQEVSIHDAEVLNKMDKGLLISSACPVIVDYIRLYNYDTETDDVKDESDPTYIDFNDYSYELNRKVPFIIWSKDTIKEAKTYHYTMGMYDVMPTLGNMFGFYNKYALGHDIFNIKDNNIVIFPTGNWLTKDMYYNNQKEESYILSNSVVGTDVIEENIKRTDKILSVSNNILVYDLIRNSKVKTVDESVVVEGK